MRELLFLFLGVFLGVLTTALMVSSAKSDEDAHQMLEKERQEQEKKEARKKERERKKELENARD